MIYRLTIDGVQITAEKGQTLVDAAKANSIYIPTLCNFEGVKPHGSCRICTVKVNGRLMTACTTPVTDGMTVECETDELHSIRKQIIEMLFVEGNHFCPACEKSGSCELQAHAYSHKMMVPRYPFLFPDRDVNTDNPKILKDQNRCIQCKRCIRGIKDEEGRNYFAFADRGKHVSVMPDAKLGQTMTDEKAMEAMDICPVGSILVKEKGYDVPIGERKYDNEPIGSDIENNN